MFLLSNSTLGSYCHLDLNHAQVTYMYTSNIPIIKVLWMQDVQANCYVVLIFIMEVFPPLPNQQMHINI